MGLKPKEIKITEFTIEESESGEVELLYIPNQTQTLYAGHTYRFVFAVDGVILEKDKVAEGG